MITFFFPLSLEKCIFLSDQSTSDFLNIYSLPQWGLWRSVYDTVNHTSYTCPPLWKWLSPQILRLKVKLTHPQGLGLPLQEGLQGVCLVYLDDVFLWRIRAKPCSCSFRCINTGFRAVNVNILQRTDSFFNPFLVDMKNGLWKKLN